MGDRAASAGPRGLFKRETKGFVTKPVRLPLERGHMQFFAEVLGETDPVFSDLIAARAQGYPDIVAPPSFAAVIETMAGEEQRRSGERPLTEVIGCDFHHLLHGEQHFAYDGLMYAGDEVVITTLVEDFFDKRGGLLEFVVLLSTISHAERGVLVRAKRTLLHRFG
jgi:hypothetical protein